MNKDRSAGTCGTDTGSGDVTAIRRFAGPPIRPWGWAVAFCLCLAATAWGSGPLEEGLPVRQVRIVGNESIPTQFLKPLVAVQEGKPLKAQAVRATLQRFFATGAFRDVVAEAQRQPGGWVVTFRCLEKIRVGVVRISGNRSLSRAQILEALGLERHSEFVPDRVDLYRDRVRERYLNEGFYRVEVDLKVTPYADGARVRIALDIRENEPARVAAFRLLGEAGTFARVLEGFRSAWLGKVYRKEAFQRELQDLQASLRQQGYWDAVLGPARVSYDRQANRVEIRLPVHAGPRYRVRFQGHAVLEEERLLETLKGLWEEGYTEDLPGTAAAYLERLYREQGYFFVRVRPEVVRRAGEVVLRFRIREGPRLRLTRIRFLGNRHVPDKELRARLRLREAGWGSPGVYLEEHLEDDVETLKSYYRTLGFLRVRIRRPRVVFHLDRTRVEVTFPIEEGERTWIRRVRVSGTTRFTEEEILSRLGVRPDRPYNELEADEDVYRILGLYAQQGYIRADVQLIRIFWDQGRSVELHYAVTEGEPVRIGAVVLRGNTRTRPWVILRELLFRPGDPYDYEAILMSRRRVARLGFFSEVRLEPLDLEARGPVRDLLLEVKEGKAGSLGISLGYGDYERQRGSLEISHQNLWGTGRRISARVQASTVEERYVLSYTEPWILELPVDLQTRALLERTERINLQTREPFYRIRRMAVASGVEKALTDTLRVSLLYQYEDTRILEIRPGAVLAPEDQGRTGVSSITPSLFVDTRDHPFDPTSGSFHGATLKLATRVLASEVDFYKLTLQSSWFFPLGRRAVVALSARGGIGHSSGASPDLPIFDRYFLGGRTTVRGYDQDTVGPKGADGTPTGGNVMLLGNAELRVRLGGGFGGVVFVDAGNVWRLLSQVRLRDLKVTAGLGLRYNTPVGPLRLDFGYKLKREPGESAGEWHFTLGHPF